MNRKYVHNLLYQIEQFIDKKLNDWMVMKLLYSKILEKYNISSSKNISSISEKDCELLLKDIKRFAKVHNVNIDMLLRNKIDKPKNT